MAASCGAPRTRRSRSSTTRSSSRREATEADEDAAPDPITAGELARAIEFAQSADNPAAGADLIAIAIDAGIDWETLTGAGVEDRDDD